MRFIDVARLTRLLARLARYAPPPRSDPRVIERREVVLGDGVRADRYAPRGATRATVIGLHGVLLRGKDDPRLVHFGRALARSGVACVVPTLPGLARGRFVPTDVELAASVVAAVASESAGGVGLVGFCFGAGYALLAAARPAVAEHVRFVVGFGAYATMDEVFASYVARRDLVPETADDWDNWIYLHVVMAHQLCGDGILDAPQLGAAAADLLERYCHDASADEKRALFEQLRPLGLLDLAAAHRDRAAQAALSPAGALSALRCAVSLVHDPRDIIVPAEQSRRLYAALRALPGGERHRLLVTTLLAHAELGDILRPGELWRLIAALEPILAAR